MPPRFRQVTALVAAVFFWFSIAACGEVQTNPNQPQPGREIPSQLEIETPPELQKSPSTAADRAPEEIQAELEESAKITEQSLKAIAQEAAERLEATKREAAQKLEATKAPTVAPDIQATAEESQGSLDDLAQKAAKGLDQTAAAAAETLEQTQAAVKETLEQGSETAETGTD